MGELITYTAAEVGSRSNWPEGTQFVALTPASPDDPPPSRTTAPVTDAERIACALERIDRWSANLETNANATENHYRARELRTRREELQALRAWLDGTEDTYIAALRNGGI